jgi:hypothetical protein
VDGLCLLVLAVMPVAAQAEPKHWFQNGVLMAAGEETPIVLFGNEINVAQNSGIGEFNCKTVGGGVIDNPVGGGAGEGKSNAGSFYECKAARCEEEVLKATGVPGRGTATLQNEPAATKEPAFPGWTNVLEESTVAGVSSIREKIGEPFVTFKTTSPPGMIRETFDCTIAPTGQVVSEAIFEGELKPEIGVAKTGNLNGSSAGAPSQMKFGTGTCPVCLHSNLGGEVTWQGNLKYLGYFHQEVITVQGSVLTAKLIPEGSVVGGEWVFPVAERKNLTIENPGPGALELLTQRIETTEGVPNFTALFLGAPEPPNCSMFNNPPVLSLPAGGKCNVAVESAGHSPVHARYLLTYKEPKEAAKTIELKMRD